MNVTSLRIVCMHLTVKDSPAERIQLHTWLQVVDTQFVALPRQHSGRRRIRAALAAHP